MSHRQRRVHVLQESKLITRAAPRFTQPPGLHRKSHLLSFKKRNPAFYTPDVCTGQTFAKAAREDLRTVINVAAAAAATASAAADDDPVQRRCIPAQATIQERTQRRRQAQASAIHRTHILMGRSDEPRATTEIPIIHAE